MTHQKDTSRKATIFGSVKFMNGLHAFEYEVAVNLHYMLTGALRPRDNRLGITKKIQISYRAESKCFHNESAIPFIQLLRSLSKVNFNYQKIRRGVIIEKGDNYIRFTY